MYVAAQLVEHILNYSTPYYDRISNSIQILLVGQEPGADYMWSRLSKQNSSATIQNAICLRVDRWLGTTFTEMVTSI